MKLLYLIGLSMLCTQGVNGMDRKKVGALFAQNHRPGTPDRPEVKKVKSHSDISQLPDIENQITVDQSESTSSQGAELEVSTAPDEISNELLMQEPVRSNSQLCLDCLCCNDVPSEDRCRVKTMVAIVAVFGIGATGAVLTYLLTRLPIF